MKLLFVFLDGVGIGPADPETNPFFRADLPVLRRLLGGTLPSLPDPVVVAEPGGHSAGVEAIAFPLDATLGHPGTPRSGTGQTALLTGVDAAERFGGHFGPWVPVALRSLVEEESLLSRAMRAGGSVAFANAYPEGWSGRRRAAAPPLAARGAGVLDRHREALASGRAVASEITNDGWRERLGFTDLPSPTPVEAGRTLAALAADHDLTLFAHYSTDLAGHRGGMEGAVEALEKVDAFLGGVIDALPAGCVLLIASDHGNVEDVTTGHTRNPALGLLAGPDAAARARPLHSLTDVTPAVLGWLEL